MTDPAVPAPPGTVPWRLPVQALVPFAALAWTAGFLPWLLHGMGRAAPVVLPLRAVLLTALVEGAVVGGLFAGGLARLVPVQRRGAALLATGWGVTAGIAGTVGQSVAASGEGSGSDADPRVLTGLVVLTVLLGLLAWGAGSLAVAGPAGAGVSLALLAGVLPGWLSSLFPSAVVVPALGTGFVWLQAVLLATALVVVGVRPRARLVGWPVVVLVAWFVGPALIAVTWLEPLLRPGSGLPRTLPDALAGAWQVFGSAASPMAREWGPWVAAVVGAVSVAVLLDGRRRELAGPAG